MKISEQGIAKIRESVECRRELQYQLEISSSTLVRWISTNTHNGPLTTYKAIEIITETTGLTKDEILD